MDLKAIQKHLYVSKNHELEIEELVRELRDSLGVGYFGYNRYYRNQSWIGIYSNYRLIELDLQHGRGPLFVDEKGISALSSGYYLNADLGNTFKLLIEEKAVDEFFQQPNIPGGKELMSDGLCIIQKGQLFDESFYFSLPPAHANNRLLFHANLKFLRAFCLYFLYKGKSLISRAERYKTYYKLPKYLHNLKSIESFKSIDELIIKKFRVSTAHGEAFLSRQEINCLRLVAKGLSYANIASELKLKNRTIESYITNIKNKLNISKRSEFIDAFNSFKIFDNAH